MKPRASSTLQTPKKPWLVAQDILPKLPSEVVMYGLPEAVAKIYSDLQKTTYLSIEGQEGKKNGAITRGK